MLGNGEFGIGDVAVELVDGGRNGGAALLEGSNFVFQGGYLGGQFATQLDNLVNFGIRSLKRIQGLQFFLNGHIGIGETFLQRYKSFPLVDGCLNFHRGGCFLGTCHKFINRFIFFCLSC